MKMPGATPCAAPIIFRRQDMTIRSLFTTALTGIGMLVAPTFTSTASAETKPATTWNPAASCNYTAISYTRSKSMVVIHTIEGSAGAAISWFKNCASNVSAHYVVGYNGAITQMVADNNIAWHVAYYNSRSIGIEHEGYAYRNTWTDTQVRQSATLTRYLTWAYGIPRSRSNIVGHSELGAAGGGHSDPGPYFNWTYYMSLVNSGSSPAPAPSPAPTSVQARKVVTDALNVRSGPGTGYSIIGTVYNGQTYIQHATSSGWSKIWYAGNTGWVYTGYTTALNGVSAIKCNTAALNVRTGPGTGYSIVGSMYSGQMYFWTQNAGLNGWYKFFWGGSGNRYCHQDYVTRVSM
jgi:N-acetyl-anhydromuramyl-L-alanine amidase AmpD